MARYHRGEPLRPEIIAPNGGILIDVSDFAAWDIAITSHRLLRPESLAAMTTPARLTDGRTVGHGLGWFLDTFNGHPFGAHWGSTVTGHSAVIRRYVDDRVTVIMLANLDDGGVGIDAMSRRIAGMYVPGADIHSLAARAGIPAERVAQVRAVLTSIGAGVEHEQAPGLAARLACAGARPHHRGAPDRRARSNGSATRASGPATSMPTPRSRR